MTMMRWTQVCQLLRATALLCTGPLGAQSVRGTVYRSDATTPAAGIVTLLLPISSDSIVARAVTSTRGGFLLRAPAAGRYRLRLLRLGHAPMTIGPIAVANVQTTWPDIMLVDKPTVLATMKVRGRDECRVRPDSGLLVAQLLGEARTALLASVSASLDGERISEYQRFARLEDTRGRLVAPEETLTVNTLSAQPFASLPPDSLARAGYVTAEGDSVVYFGPDAEVLLSDAFAAGHCFQVVEGTGARASSIGVAFRPVATRRGVVDIRGTLWLDRATSTLQSVEYSYDPTPYDERRAGVGGDVHFARTDGGFWFVSRWTIRMPRVAARRTAAILGPRPIAARTVRVIEGVRRSGGEVVAMYVNDEIAYRRPSLVTAAAVSAQPAAASASAAALASASAPAPASTSAASDTSNAAMTATAALLVRVRADDGAVVAGADVRVSMPGTMQSARSDSVGVARFVGLGAGDAELHVRRVGYREGGLRTRLQTGNNEVAVVVRGSTVTLESMTTFADGNRPARLADVDARIARGEPSAVVTRADIDKRNPLVLSQMLRGVAGLRLADSSGAMVAISTRGAKLKREGMMVPCVMRVMMDGVIMSASVDIDNVIPYAVHAVEVFYGGARVPPQFGGIRTDQWCGLIAIWTR